MIDSALVGLVGTATGALIGFAGSALTTLFTARSTRKREERARLFTERRRTYSDLIGTVQEFTTAITSIQRPLLADRNREIYELTQKVGRAVNDVEIIAPDLVREQAKILYPIVLELSDEYAKIEREWEEVREMGDGEQVAMINAQRLVDATPDGLDRVKRLAQENFTWDSDGKLAQVLYSYSSDFPTYAANHPVAVSLISKYQEQVEKLSLSMRTSLNIPD